MRTAEQLVTAAHELARACQKRGLTSKAAWLVITEVEEQRLCVHFGKPRHSRISQLLGVNVGHLIQ